MAISGCATLNVKNHETVDFRAAATYSSLQLAARHAAENLGGEVIEHPNPSPASITGGEHGNNSGWFAIYTPMEANPTLDTADYFFRTDDTVELTVHAYHPLIISTAFTQELSRPAAVREAEQRDSAVTLMPLKSKKIFMALTMLDPGVGNMYLLADNPFVFRANVLPEVVFPFLVDAGLIYFAVAESGKTHKPGTYIAGLTALSLRIAGIAGFSAEIDRYNCLAHSGYDLSRDALKDAQAKFSLTIQLP